MRCEDARLNLNAAVDGELGRTARLALRAHLLRCADCRRELASLRTLSQQLAVMPAPTPFARVHEVAAAAAQAAVPSSTLPVRPRRWALVAGGSTLVVAAALFLLFRPTPAQAAYRSMISAIEEVTTFHVAYWLGSPDRPRKTCEQWYQDGKWRLEDPEGVVQVYDGTQLDQYLPWSNTVFLGVSNQPFGTSFGGFTVTDMLKQEGDSQVEMSAARGPDGETLTRFVVTGERERMVILADPHSDLPVSVEMYAHTPSGWELRGGTEEIEYNVPLDPALFTLAPPEGATVIDHAEWDAAWEQRYEKGMGRAMLGDHEVVLRDVQVTSTGNVFTIWSGTNPGVTQHAAPGQPEWYDLDAELTDSLGTIYLRNFFSAKGPSRTYFVPVAEPSSHPAWYELTVIERSGQRGEQVQSARFRVAEPTYSPLPDPIYPATKGGIGTGFVFARQPLGAADDAELRAKYWEQQGDLRKALSLWEQCIAITDDYADHRDWSQPYWWRHIGELYEKLGMRAEARQAYQRGLDCDDGEDYNKGDVRALREALKRLR